MRNFRQTNQEPIPFTAPSGGVVSGRPVIIGDFVVVPQVTADEGEVFAGLIEGVFVFTKASGFAATAGAVAYHDFGSDHRMESSGVPIGRYAAAAASGDTTAKVMLLPELNALEQGPQEFQFALRPPNGVAATVVFDWTAPAAGELDSVDARTNARPSSSSGTVQETITNLTGSVAMLAATLDLETGITNDTTLAMGLHGTQANKQFAAGDVLRFAIAASNADVVAGGGISHRVKWHRI